MSLRRRYSHLQVLADFHQCATPHRYLQDPSVIKRVLQDAVRQSGMRIITSLFHQFGSQGRGVTGLFVVAESHLVIHTWPERNLLNLDVFFCNLTKNNERKAQQVLARLVKLYRPTRIIKKVIRHRL